MLFQNICSDASSVHDYWNLGKTRVRTEKLEDLTVLKCSPDLLNNVKIGQDQPWGVTPNLESLMTINF